MSVKEEPLNNIKVVRVDSMKSSSNQKKTKKNTDYLKNIIRNKTELTNDNNSTVLEIKKLLAKKTKKNVEDNGVGKNNNKPLIKKINEKKDKDIKKNIKKTVTKDSNKSLLERIQNNLNKKIEKKIEKNVDKRSEKIDKLLKKKKPQLKIKNKIKNKKLMDLIKNSSNIILSKTKKPKKNVKKNVKKSKKTVIKAKITKSVEKNEDIYHNVISKITDKKIDKKIDNINLTDIKKELIENKLIDKDSNAPKKVLLDIYKLFSLSKNIIIK